MFMENLSLFTHLLLSCFCVFLTLRQLLSSSHAIKQLVLY